jgi:hypothetical protein
MERVRERHVAVPVVVPVGLAVGRDVHELRTRRALGEGPGQSLREALPVESRLSNATARETGPS